LLHLQPRDVNCSNRLRCVPCSSPHGNLGPTGQAQKRTSPTGEWLSSRGLGGTGARESKGCCCRCKALSRKGCWPLGQAVGREGAANLASVRKLVLRVDPSSVSRPPTQSTKKDTATVSVDTASNEWTAGSSSSNRAAVATLAPPALFGANMSPSGGGGGGGGGENKIGGQRVGGKMWGVTQAVDEGNKSRREAGGGAVWLGSVGGVSHMMGRLLYQGYCI